jgi:hypothetical protein
MASDPRALRVTWIAWGLIVLVGSAVVVCHPECEQANDSYARGATRWLAGEDLYDQGGCGFIYLPQSALLYSPLTLIPRPLEQIVWRIVTIGLFVAGIARLCGLARNGSGLEFFPLVTVLVLPKAWAGIIHGQAAPAMAGLSMLAMVEIHRQRWGRAAALLIAALAVKPLAIVLILLVAALYRPLAGRLLLGLAGLLLVPFLTQNPDYVITQYVASIEMFQEAAQRGQTTAWPHLFSLASLAGIEIDATWQTVLRLAAALGTLALCWRVKSEFRIPKSEIASRSLLAIYALATVYLLLFNPRTENNSYLILSPVMALLCVRAYFEEGRTVRAALLLAGTIALFAGHEICGFLTPQFGFVWISPLTCLVFSIDLVRTALSPTVNSTLRDTNQNSAGEDSFVSIPGKKCARRRHRARRRGGTIHAE